MIAQIAISGNGTACRNARQAVIFLGSVAQRRMHLTVNKAHWKHRRFESFPAHYFAEVAQLAEHPA